MVKVEQDLLLNILDKLFTTENGKKLLKEILDKCTYQIELKKVVNEDNESRMVINVRIECPTIGDRLLFLLT